MVVRFVRIKLKKNMRSELQDELQGLKASYQAILANRNKRFMMWVVRNIIAVGLIWYFWEKSWMNTALVVWLIFTLVSLAALFIMPMMLKRKIDALEKSIARIGDVIGEEE